MERVNALKDSLSLAGTASFSNSETQFKDVNEGFQNTDKQTFEKDESNIPSQQSYNDASEKEAAIAAGDTKPAPWLIEPPSPLEEESDPVQTVAAGNADQSLPLYEHIPINGQQSNPPEDKLKVPDGIKAAVKMLHEHIVNRIHERAGKAIPCSEIKYTIADLTSDELEAFEKIKAAAMGHTQQKNEVSDNVTRTQNG